MNLGSHGILKRKDVYGYLDTEGLNEAVLLWKDYKRFGLAHGRGPADETEEYISLIRAFEDEYDEAVAETRKEAGRKK